MSALILAAATAVATNLPTVVVEASRLDSTPMDVPSAVRVIGREAISASGARDAVDLVSKVAPEVHLRRLGAGNPALADVSMRGYGENGHGRTLVLVDGERLNSPDMSAPSIAGIRYRHLPQAIATARQPLILFAMNLAIARVSL